MPSEAAEAIWTRREDRPQGGFSHGSRRIPRAMGADPDDWARAFNARGFNVYVIAGQIAGQTSSTESTFFGSVHVDPDHSHGQARMLEEARTYLLVHRVHSYLEGNVDRMGSAHNLRLEQPNSDRELQLYKEELKRLRSERNNEDQQSREKKKAASEYLEEAIALAHPIVLRLLGWLHVNGRLDLKRVFEVFGPSSSTFEGLARLHLIGALKFDHGELTITSLGRRALREFGIINPNEAEDSEPPAGP